MHKDELGFARPAKRGERILQRNQTTAEWISDASNLKELEGRAYTAVPAMIAASGASAAEWVGEKLGFGDDKLSPDENFQGQELTRKLFESAKFSAMSPEEQAEKRASLKAQEDQEKAVVHEKRSELLNPERLDQKKRMYMARATNIYGSLGFNDDMLLSMARGLAEADGDSFEGLSRDETLKLGAGMRKASAKNDWLPSDAKERGAAARKENASAKIDDGFFLTERSFTRQ